MRKCPNSMTSKTPTTTILDHDDDELDVVDHRTTRDSIGCETTRTKMTVMTIDDVRYDDHRHDDDQARQNSSCLVLTFYSTSSLSELAPFSLAFSFSF